MSSSAAQIIATRFRQDVLSMHAYAIQDSRGMVKLDAMENPHRLPPALQAELGRRLGAVATGAAQRHDAGQISYRMDESAFPGDYGRMVHDMYLMQVKSPDKSTEPWDYYNVVETIKGDAAWTTKAESKCPLWK